jgi:hypothetical protein
MTLSKKKANISRKNLESHGVYYIEDLYRPPYILLPEHVDAVREVLLSFNGTVPGGGWIKTLRLEAQEYLSDQDHDIGPEALLPPDNSMISTEHYETDLNDRSPEWLLAYENMKSCRKVAKIARGLGRESENGWVDFWCSHTFNTASKKAREQPGFQ